MEKLLKKYQDTGKFNFDLNENLKNVCNAPNNKCGVYLFYGINGSSKILVYIGCSGHIKNDGSLSIRKTGMGGIKGRIVNGHQFGKVQRHISLPLQMKIDNFSSLEVKWYVTHDKTYIDSPSFVESCLLQYYFEEYKRLPKWNEKF